jgi:hypothetical protein
MSSVPSKPCLDFCMSTHAQTTSFTAQLSFVASKASRGRYGEIAIAFASKSPVKSATFDLDKHLVTLQLRSSSVTSVPLEMQVYSSAEAWQMCGSSGDVKIKLTRAQPAPLSVDRKQPVGMPPLGIVLCDVSGMHVLFDVQGMRWTISKPCLAPSWSYTCFAIG